MKCWIQVIAIRLIHRFMFLIAEFAEYEVKPTIYTYSELQVITKSFSMKLGQGGFGSVYKVSATTCTTIANVLWRFN
jgi:hypothetical protein